MTNHLLFVYFTKLILQQSCHGCKSAYDQSHTHYTGKAGVGQRDNDFGLPIEKY